MKNSTISISLSAFGAALIAVLSQVSITLGPVPFTLQTLAIALIVSLFHTKEALMSVSLYLFLGGLGLPVFSGGSAGLASLFGPTSGFLWGFISYALITPSYLKNRQTGWDLLIGNILGDTSVFILGLLSLHFLANMTWTAAFLAGVVPFLIPELCKLLLLLPLVPKIKRALASIPYYK